MHTRKSWETTHLCISLANPLNARLIIFFFCLPELYYSILNEILPFPCGVSDKAMNIMLNEFAKAKLQGGIWISQRLRISYHSFTSLHFLGGQKHRKLRRHTPPKAAALILGLTHHELLRSNPCKFANLRNAKLLPYFQHIWRKIERWFIHVANTDECCCTSSCCIIWMHILVITRQPHGIHLHLKQLANCWQRIYYQMGFSIRNIRSREIEKYRWQSFTDLCANGEIPPCWLLTVTLEVV